MPLSTGPNCTRIKSSLIFILCATNFMSHIYGMDSPIDTTRARTVWDLHVSTIKWGSLTFTQLSQVCCHGIYCHKCTTQVNNAICKKQVIAIYGFVLSQMANSFSLSCFNIPHYCSLGFKTVIHWPNKVIYFQAMDKLFTSCL